ncbi:MAG: hypothetical protein FWB85_11425 [Chitinispirillia bacterium]|nr:hypothetical protein [Chitinispirillia bacterium]
MSEELQSAIEQGDPKAEEPKKVFLSRGRKKKLIIMAIGATIYGAPLLYLSVDTGTLGNNYSAVLIAAFLGIGVGPFFSLLGKCLTGSLFGIKTPNPLPNTTAYGHREDPIAALFGPRMILFIIILCVRCISACVLFFISPFIAIYQFLQKS